MKKTKIQKIDKIEDIADEFIKEITEKDNGQIDVYLRNFAEMLTEEQGLMLVEAISKHTLHNDIKR